MGLGATTLLAYSHYRGGSKIFASDVRDDDLRLHSGEDGASLIAYTRRYAKDSGKSGISDLLPWVAFEALA